MHDSCFTSDGKYGCVINCCIASRPIKPLEIVCMQMHFVQNKGCLTDWWFILMFGCYFRVGKTKKELLWNITLSVYIYIYIHMRHEASVNLTQLWHRTEQLRVWYSSSCYWSLTSKNSNICQPRVSDSIHLTDIPIYRRKRLHIVFFFLSSWWKDKSRQDIKRSVL